MKNRVYRYVLILSLSLHGAGSYLHGMMGAPTTWGKPTEISNNYGKIIDPIKKALKKEAGNVKVAANVKDLKDALDTNLLSLKSVTDVFITYKQVADEKSNVGKINAMIKKTIAADMDELLKKVEEIVVHISNKQDDGTISFSEMAANNIHTLLIDKADFSKATTASLYGLVMRLAQYFSIQDGKSFENSTKKLYEQALKAIESLYRGIVLAVDLEIAGADKIKAERIKAEAEIESLTQSSSQVTPQMVTKVVATALKQVPALVREAKFVDKTALNATLHTYASTGALDMVKARVKRIEDVEPAFEEKLAKKVDTTEANTTLAGAVTKLITDHAPKAGTGGGLVYDSALLGSSGMNITNNIAFVENKSNEQSDANKYAGAFSAELYAKLKDMPSDKERGDFIKKIITTVDGFDTSKIDYKALVEAAGKELVASKSADILAIKEVKEKAAEAVANEITTKSDTTYKAVLENAIKTTVNSVEVKNAVIAKIDGPLVTNAVKDRVAGGTFDAEIKNAMGKLEFSTALGGVVDKATVVTEFFKKNPTLADEVKASLETKINKLNKEDVVADLTSEINAGKVTLTLPAVAELRNKYMNLEVIVTNNEKDTKTSIDRLEQEIQKIIQPTTGTLALLEEEVKNLKSGSAGSGSVDLTSVNTAIASLNDHFKSGGQVDLLKTDVGALKTQVTTLGTQVKGLDVKAIDAQLQVMAKILQDMLAKLPTKP